MVQAIKKLIKYGVDNITNVILITIDCLRADHLSCMKYSRKTTPNLDKIANAGVLFTQAISNGCATNASFPAILTSTYFSKYEDIPYLSEKRTTLAEVLKDSGYSTAAFHSNAWLSKNFHYNRGFERFVDFEIRESSKTKEEILRMDADIPRNKIIQYLKDNLKRRLDQTSTQYKWLRKIYRYYNYKISLPYIKAESINEKAEAWLEENSNKFFLWLHYMDIHVPYSPPPDCVKHFRSKNINTFKKVQLIENSREKKNVSKEDFDALIDLYDSSLLYVDQCIGDLVEYLKKTDNFDDTSIIITADHGEEFNEHGGFYHNPAKLYDESIHVPLIMIHKDNSFEKKTITQQVQLLDLAPTIVDFLGVKYIENFQGKSLIPVIYEEKDTDSLGVISESSYNLSASLISYRTEEWKYIIDIKNNKHELYNLQRDPGETMNVINGHPNVREQFELILSKHISTMQNKSESKVYIDELIKKRLKMLGY